MDSYPTWLGQNMVDFVQSTSIEEMREIFNKIVLVTDKDVPLDEELVLWRLTDKIGSQFEWYSFLREYQGDLSAYKGDLIYMEDNCDFIKHSMACEWAYIVNLDEGVLEVYRGYQKTEPNNRYSGFVYQANDLSSYYPCKLVETYSFDDINGDAMERLEQKFYANS
jgi:hypothetical protein